MLGVGYGDYLKGLETVTNNFYAKAITTYTDNYGENSYQLLEGKTDRKTPKDRISGTFDIDSSDTFPVAYIEAKAYPNSLHEGLPKLQNILTASKMVSIKEDIPNLNIGYFDENGVLRGYLLAYLAKDYEGKEVIYVHDAAVLPQSQGAGIYKKLNQELIRRIKNSDRLSQLEIVRVARENTSYPIIKKLSRGLEYEIVKDVPITRSHEPMRILRLKT